MNVCISRPFAPNEIMDIASYQNATIAEFSEIIKLSNKNIFYKTPYYTEKLDDDIRPFVTYPELILESNDIPKYPIPDFCLIINEQTHNQYSLFVSITTQLEDTDFPMMEVEFTQDELILWNSKDFLKKCTEVFEFQCTDTFLLNSSEEVIEDDFPLKDLFKFAKSSHLIFKCTIDDSCIENIHKRKLVIEEILSSEVGFVNNIQILHDYWYPELLDSEIFDRFQLKLIFKEIGPFLNTHVELIRLISKLNKRYAAEVGPLFLNYVDHFKVAIPFVTNYKRADDMIQKKRLSSRSIDKKFQELAEGSPMKEGGDFSSYYITPVQRYPRYTLLIRDLDKYTPSFHPDKPYLSLAEEALIIVNKEIDETSQQIKQQLLIGEIQKKLPDDFIITKNDRNLIDKKKVTVHRKLSVKKGIIYLFNDSVLITKKGKKKRKPILFSQIEDFRFVSPSSDSILLIIKDVEVTLVFENSEERTSLMKLLDQARTIYLSTIKCETKFIKWTEIELGETLVPLMNLDGCSINDKAYFFGGINSSLMPCSALIEYNSNIDNWCLKSSPVEPRIGHTVTSIGNKFYICFGFNKSDYFPDIWEFDGNHWKSIPLNEDIHLAFHSTIAYGNNLVVFGGKNENGFSNRLYKIDPNNGNVTHIHPKETPSGRANHAAVYFDNKMVVIGGENNLIGSGIVGDVDVYYFNENIWSKMKNAEIRPRICHKAIVLKDYIFVIGGASDFEDNFADESKKLPNECIDPIGWRKIEFNEFGNSPFGLSKFAIAHTSKTSAITYGGIDPVTKMPFASSWMFDMKEGFNNNSNSNQA